MKSVEIKWISGSPWRCMGKEPWLVAKALRLDSLRVEKEYLQSIGSHYTVDQKRSGGKCQVEYTACPGLGQCQVYLSIPSIQEYLVALRKSK